MNSTKQLFEELTATVIEKTLDAVKKEKDTTLSAATVDLISLSMSLVVLVKD